MLNKGKGISGDFVHNGSLTVFHHWHHVGVHNEDFTICAEGEDQLDMDILVIE